MYIVIETQTTNDSVVVAPPVSFNNIDKAYQKFYMILAAAAVSNIPIHAAIMLNEKGELIRSEYFDHTVIENESME